MRVKIPFLHCLWNDVLFLTAIHPQHLRLAFKEAGVPLKTLRWFKIPLSKLNQKNMVIQYWDDSVNEQYERFNTRKIDFLSKVSSISIDYYRKVFFYLKRRPLLFQYQPHVFYKGTIDVSGCDIITG